MPLLVINEDPFLNEGLESVFLWHLGLGQLSDLELLQLHCWSTFQVMQMLESV